MAPGDNLRQSQVMLQAASSGQAAVQHASDQLMQQYQAGSQQANQTAQIAGQTLHQGAQLDEQKREFNISAQQQEDRTDLDAAKSGFERNDRAAKLEQEMQRGAGQPQIGPLETEAQNRLRMQAGQPLEQDQGGTWRSTDQRNKSLAREEKRKDFEAVTDRIRAEGYKDQIGLQAQRAHAAGDQETFKERAQLLSKVPNQLQGVYDDFVKGDVKEHTWGDLARMAAGSEDADPTLMQDIKNKNPSDRVREFVRAQVAIEGLKYVVRSGGDTKNLDVDTLSPKWQEFLRTSEQVDLFMKSVPFLTPLAFINSTQDKMRFVHAQAAALMLMGQNPQQQQMPTPATMAPQQQGQLQQGPQGQTIGQQLWGGGLGENFANDFLKSKGATPDMTQRAIQARQSGDQTVPPTDSPEFQQRFGR